MNDERPAKRPRSSDNASPSDTSNREASGSTQSSSPNPLGLQRHKELWFEDGNVVLVAQDTAFRVFRGLLAEHSTVFADMFATSSPASEETLDGCPVVRLSDSSHDLAHLLRVVVPTKDTCYLWRPSSGSVNFEQVFAVTTLAHKYHMESIEHQGLAVLKSHFCTTYDSWCEASHFNEHIEIQAIGAVNIARLTNTLSILPSALHVCGGFILGALNGWKRADGSVERLSEQDIRLAIEGRDTLARRGDVEIFHVIMEGRSPKCTTRAVCDSLARHDVPCEVRTRLLDKIQFFDFHEGMDLVEYVTSPTCEACRASMASFAEEKLRGMWKDLPSIMGMEVDEWDKDL